MQSVYTHLKCSSMLYVAKWLSMITDYNNSRLFQILADYVKFVIILSSGTWKWQAAPNCCLENALKIVYQNGLLKRHIMFSVL